MPAVNPEPVRGNADLLFPTEFVKAAELQGRDVNLTIKEIQREDLMMKGQEPERKITLLFEETEKRMVTNKTNILSIAKVHGKETDLWIGKRITLYPTTVRVGRETRDCIRVREREPPPKKQQVKSENDGAA